MYFWINFLLWNLGVLWFGLFFSLTLEPRWERVPRWASAVSFTLFMLPVAYLKITHPLSEALYWAVIACILLYVFIAFRDKLWKKILLFILFNVISYIGSIFGALFMGYAGESFDASFNSSIMLATVAVNTAVVIILLVLLLVAWNRFVSHKTAARHIVIFFIFPLSQMTMLYAFNDTTCIAPSSGSIFICAGIILGFIADFILLYVLMEQDRKEALEKQLQELETLHRVENVHYQDIEARREEMAKIRHDFNNQLITAYHLTEQAEPERARALLDALRANLIGIKEYVYCGNPVVNAVLNEKAALCQSNGIRLETDLEMGEEPNIQPVHLCSIFSNFLDNAVQAAKKCPESERFIRVKSGRNNDYLIIKVENSSAEPKKAAAGRKGYGQEILRDIALQYSGEFITDWKDGVYRAMLSLMAAK